MNSSRVYFWIREKATGELTVGARYLDPAIKQHRWEVLLDQHYHDACSEEDFEEFWEMVGVIQEPVILTGK